MATASTTLGHLKRHIHACRDSGDLEEVRAYMLSEEHCGLIAEALGVEEDNLRGIVVDQSDDDLHGKTLATIAKRLERGRDTKRGDKFAASSNAAAALAASAVPREQGGYELDLAGLLTAAALVKGGCEVPQIAFCVADERIASVECGALVRFAKLKIDARAWVDASGLHVRWLRRGRIGGLNLRSAALAGATTVHVRREQVAA